MGRGLHTQFSGMTSWYRGSWLCYYISKWSELGLAVDVIWNGYKASRDCPTDDTADPPLKPDTDGLSWALLDDDAAGRKLTTVSFVLG